MSGIEALQAIGGAAPFSPPDGLTNTPPAANNGFGSVLEQAFANMETKVSNADRAVQQFALDDSVPLHQVTFALEEARLAVEFAMQVRTRLVEGYRELMNMQL